MQVETSDFVNGYTDPDPLTASQILYQMGFANHFVVIHSQRLNNNIAKNDPDIVFPHRSTEARLAIESNQHVQVVIEGTL